MDLLKTEPLCPEKHLYFITTTDNVAIKVEKQMLFRIRKPLWVQADLRLIYCRMTGSQPFFDNNDGRVEWSVEHDGRFWLLRVQFNNTVHGRVWAQM